MKKIITLAGSNSQRSINQQLVSYAAYKIEDAIILPIDLNDFVLPIYGVDYEDENGIPSAVKKLDRIFHEADGFVISLAEHNGSYAAVFKNAIDWLSRIDMKIWKNKPMLVMATSPGGRGGATVLQAAKGYFPFMGARIIADFSLPLFYDHFSEGELIQPELKEELEEKIKVFRAELDA